MSTERRDSQNRILCSKRRRQGDLCTQPAMKGKDCCRYHGGKSKKKHGLYSKYRPPKRLAKRIAELAADPKTKDLKEVGAHCRALTEELLAQVGDAEALTPEQGESLVPMLREWQRAATSYNRLALDARYVDAVEAEAWIGRAIAAVLQFVPEEKHERALAAARKVPGDDGQSESAARRSPTSAIDGMPRRTREPA